MKKLLLLLLVLNSFLASAKIPDILVYSKSTTNWNVFLLEEFRVFMNNLNMTGVDPKNLNLSDPIIYSEENIKKYVTDDLNNTLSNIGDIIGFEFVNIKPRLVVNEFGYAIKTITPTITPVEDSEGNVTLRSTISLKGLEASAKDISIEFEVEGLTKKPRVRIHNPTVVLKRGAELDFDLDVKFVEGKGFMNLELSNGNFSRITDQLANDPDFIDIIFDEEMIEFPDIRGSFAGRELVLNHQRIIDIILENKSNLKVLLFDQLHQLLKQNIADELLKKFNNISFKSDMWIPAVSDSIFPIYLNLLDFSVPFDNIFMAEIAGDFCTTRNFVENAENCINRRITPEPKSTRTESDLDKSKRKIQNDFNSRKDMKFVASISEEYINRSIVTTYDFGLWDPILDEMGVKLGDKNILIKLDETGNNATILMDIKYELTKLQGIALKSKFVRFPAILKATARVDENGEYEGKKSAQVIFNVYDVVLNDEVLRNGHVEYGFPSNVKDMRRIFRKKVIKLIKAELFDYDAETAVERLGAWSGVDLPAVALPEINNMHLEKMKLESDGLGRMNIVLEGPTPIFRRKSRKRAKRLVDLGTGLDK